MDDVIELPVQINGKVRGKVTIARAAREDEAREAALAEENVKRFVADKVVKKIVYVPGRILNVIIG